MPIRSLLALPCVLLGGAAAASIIYVDADALGDEGGDDWENAKTELRAALLAAQPGDEIWVAEGIYHPSLDDRTASFELVSGVEVYGGFRGDEASREQRDWTAHETILSGEIGEPDDPYYESFPPVPRDRAGMERLRAWERGANKRYPDSDNILHVVVGSGTDRSAVLDGFTITRGFANGDGPYGTRGGGMLNVAGSPTLRNLEFRENDCAFVGGAMANLDGSEPWIEFCRFVGRNHASYRGGAIENENSCPEIRDCLFQENFAGVAVGGLSYAGSDCANTLERLRFMDNCAIDGTAALAASASLRLVDLVAIGNIGGSSGAMVGGSRIVGARFEGNFAEFGGGGGYSGVADISNALFVGNFALGLATNDGQGGAVRLRGSPTLRQVTITGNYGGLGGGIGLARGATPTFVNSVVWGNEVSHFSPPHTANVGGDGVVQFVHCLIEGSGGSGPGWDDRLGTDVGGNLDADPLFVDAGANDFRLGPDSPAIDAGDDALVPADLLVDLDGQPRVSGEAVDMGAFESAASVVPIRATSFGRFRARQIAPDRP